MMVKSKVTDIASSIDIFLDLVRKYAAIFSFIMIGIMFFIDLALDWWLTILLAVAITALLIGIVLIDWRFIYPKKVKKLSLNNPVTVEILERLERIERM